MDPVTREAVTRVAGKAFLMSYFALLIAALSSGTMNLFALIVGVVTGLFAVSIVIGAATVLALDENNDNTDR